MLKATTVGCLLLAFLGAAGYVVLFRTPCRTCRSKIWEETLDTATQKSFDYCGAFHAAQGGDASALDLLFEFRTDAAAALGHGVALVEVLQVIGDDRFAEAIRRQPAENRRRLGHLLEAGVAEGLNRNPAETAALFPRSDEAAFEGEKRTSVHRKRR